MKIFCLIFSFYLLLLSAQPCQDLAVGHEGGGGGTVLAQAETESRRLGEGERDAGHEAEECSPFCICSCRQISVMDNIPGPSSSEEIAVFLRPNSRTAYQIEYSHQPPNAIWQPPKFNHTV